MTHPRSFRIVAPDPLVPLVRAFLEAQGFAFESEAFSPLAYRLREEPFPLGRSLAAFFGYLYIQDRSSMLPPLVLDPGSGATVLDMCASPGSKTGLLAQLVGPEGLVLGNEPNPARLVTLRRNVQQLNLFPIVTCCHSGDALPLPDACFEHILLDPPCSGWGTTDRHPSVLKLWQGDKVDPLIRLQQSLLREAARLLKPGGRLVYSTCTTNVEENEAQVRYARDVLGLCPVPVTPPAGLRYMDPALPDVDGVLRIDEEASEAQGFFVAAFEQAGNPGDGAAPLPGTAAPWMELEDAAVRAAGLDPGKLGRGRVGVFKDTAHWLPEKALALLPAALRWQGVALGKYAGLFRPSGLVHACLREDDFADIPRLELDETEIAGLTQGRSLNTGLRGRQARLFWRDLPLGLLTLKNGRAVWNARG